MARKIYVVSMKHYGGDDCCGCEFQPVKAFKSVLAAKEYADKNEEYDFDVVELEDK